jgi:hypothetical protein
MVPPTRREVAASATVTLDHDAYFGRVCGDGFAVVSRTGVVTVLDSRLRTVRRLDFGGPVGDLSVSGDRWAWVVDAQLWIGDPDGGGISTPWEGAPACRWASSGQALWVANGAGDEVRVEQRTPDGRVTRTVTVPDSFGDSMVRLRHHPHADAIVLWIAAGQDGQQSWLVQDDGTALTAAHLPADDCLPALFGPDGDWLLAAGDDGLTKRSWPDRAELSTLTWEDIDPDAAGEDSDAPGGCLMSLPGGFVSWDTDNGRLRTIDVTRMSVVDEIMVEGHSGGDFCYAVPRGDGTVLSVHGRGTLVLSALRDWSPGSTRTSSHFNI